MRMLLMSVFMLLLFSNFSLSLCAQTQTDTMYAYLTPVPVVVDGSDSDVCWATADWQPMSNVWIPYNQKMKDGDFSGRFKLAWDSLYLYLLAEIIDDSISDDHVSPFTNYWDDDCLEIFIDEDRSKGDHLSNNNAFAYHISLTYDAIDGGTGSTVNCKDNISVVMDTIAEHTYLWEVAIKNYDANFNLNNSEASRVFLHHKKIMGFSLAYCDNDETNARENFIGSTYMDESVANNNYITADYFGTLLLVDPNFDQTAVETFDRSNAFNVFPNPVSDYLNIEINAPESEILMLEIRDLTGRIVLRQNDKSVVNKIYVGELKSGMYIINLISEDQVYTKSFVKKN